MKLNKKLVIAAAVVGAVGMASAPISASAKGKCYGVAQAGKNDCQGPGHSCAGQSTKAYDINEWKWADSKEACDKLSHDSKGDHDHKFVPVGK